MARGTVNGEAVVSQAATEEYRSNHDRIFGARKPQRGRWVATPDGLVPADQYVPPSAVSRVPVVTDAFMDGAVSQDGVDIGSRRKRAEYMARNGVVDASDVSREFLARQRAAREQATCEQTKAAVVELSKVDTRHLPKAIEELRRKR